MPLERCGVSLARVVARLGWRSNTPGVPVQPGELRMGDCGYPSLEATSGLLCKVFAQQ